MDYTLRVETGAVVRRLGYLLEYSPRARPAAEIVIGNVRLA
jgi:predicted transcriptional regulator of viral defense system